MGATGVTAPPLAAWGGPLRRASRSSSCLRMAATASWACLRPWRCSRSSWWSSSVHSWGSNASLVGHSILLAEVAPQVKDCDIQLDGSELGLQLKLLERPSQLLGLQLTARQEPVSRHVQALVLTKATTPARPQAPGEETEVEQGPKKGTSLWP
uniref:Uncharacterized protein n=1 Tax=Pyrodinium bahamense TaxID=73915 RepID=A0A7S0FKK9_9DINO